MAVALLVAIAIVATSSADAGWENLRWAEVLQSSSLFHVTTAPDRAHGMLVAAIDLGVTPRRVVVTRVDHNGTEVWGDGGIYLPITLGTIETHPPLALCPGQGGAAYVAFVEERETVDMLRLARIEPDGTHAWTVDVDGLSGGIPVDGRDVKMFGTIPGGDVLVTWVKEEPVTELYAARFNADGSRPWHGPINDHWRPGTRWEVFTDAQGGLLVVFSRSYGVEPTPHYVNVQRLEGTTGARMWGSDGVYLWLTDEWGAVNDIVHDGNGGAWVLRSDFGTVYAQRVDSAGNVVWPSDLMVLDTPYSSFSYSEMCPDVDGGFFLAHGDEELFVQRVNLDGTLPWGSGGRSIATAMSSVGAVSIRRDGLGGVVIGYYNVFYISDPMSPCLQTHVARVDAFGNLLWDRLLAQCTEDWSNPGVILDNPSPEGSFGDGSGGAISAFSIQEISGGTTSVIGYGLDQHGEDPTPRLTQLIPDAAQPGGATNYLVYGDYLDLTLDYELVHAHATSRLTLAPTEMHGYQLVEGFTTLPELASGAYHLVVDALLAPPDTLHFALGIGDPPECGRDDSIVESENALSLEGSLRQSAIDADGGIHLTWIEQDAGSGNFGLMYLRVNGSQPPRTIYLSRNRLKHPTLAVDALGRVHLAVVREESASVDTVVRLRLGEGLEVAEMDEWGGVYEHANPVIVIAGEATVHIVFETTGTTDPYVGARLEHVMIDGENQSHVIIEVGTFPRDADVVAVGGNLLLTYVESELVPGVERVWAKRCRPGFPPTWEPSEILHSAYHVRSPSVAWDGAGRLLFAWIADDAPIGGEPALVHTVHWEAGEWGEIRAHPGQAQHHAVSIGSTGSGRFAMLTLESEGGPDLGVWLRDGDGRCFLPRRQLNDTRDVGTPLLATSVVTGARMVHWQDYDTAPLPIRASYCASTGTAVPQDQTPAVLAHELQCRPNPFNPSATLSFRLAEAGLVRLAIYDVRGRMVRSLVDARLPAGEHELRWDGRDGRGVLLGSGMYFARLSRPGGGTSITKVALVK